MAKISGRGFKELARANTSRTLEGFDSPITGILVVRTDGKLLSRLTGDVGTGYTIVGTFKSAPTTKQEAHEAIRRYADRRGMTITKEG